jgi:sugar phosphate isomerase/epimerase|tara:strand:- start:19 stop:273 length:255 start_codon:yes stop_codon:yes gene_type:complete
LISIHLHDNDGATDLHQCPFSGTVDWALVAELLAQSSYGKCVSLEVMIHHSGTSDEATFLEKAHACGLRLEELITAAAVSQGSA